MLMRDIPEERRLAGFPRVAMPGIHADVLEVRAESRPWEEFEGLLLDKYGWMTRSGFRSGTSWNGWTPPAKGETRQYSSGILRNASRLSALDRTILDTSRVLLFVKSVDERDRDQVGSLLETEDGLTADWAAVKRVCAVSTSGENGLIMG